jgi:hypothetical protein
VHLEELAGPLGIWQHATGIAPNEAFGYCTDDVARALSLDLLHRHQLGWDAVRPDVLRSLAFLREAFDPATGSFRNFRSANGTWLDGVGSEDCQGRALLAIGETARSAPDQAMRLEAGALFRAALPVASRLTALRAISSALLGCDAVLEGGFAGDTSRTMASLAGRLRLVFGRLDLDGGWPWPEPVLTYENALLPRALIVAGRRLADPELGRIGLRVLDWLIDVQTSRGGEFSPIGNRGWWPRGGKRGRFDQQPIEAAATILAAAVALDVTADVRYRRAADAAYGWFLGDNDAGVSVADVIRGGCRDGLSARSVSLNQGAESTLMWLTALETIRHVRSLAAVAVTTRTRDEAALMVGVRP